VLTLTLTLTLSLSLSLSLSLNADAADSRLTPDGRGSSRLHALRGYGQG